MFTPFTEPMHIHSLNGQLRDATIIDKVGDNKYIAEYEGVKCTAIFNPFVGRYYVDDKYGVIRIERPADMNRPDDRFQRQACFHGGFASRKRR